MPPRHAPNKAESALLPEFNYLTREHIHIPQTDAEWADTSQALHQATALGFDTESKPIFQAGQTDTGPHVVQLATQQDAWLLQLHHPQASGLVRAILANPHIIKVGFGLDNDKQQLQRTMQAEPQQLIDLDQFFSCQGYTRNLGLRAAVAVVLQQSLHKSKRLSTSNWAKKQLSEAQIHYAANDAHAALCVYAALPAWQSTFSPPQTTDLAPAKP